MPSASCVQQVAEVWMSYQQAVWLIVLPEQ